MHPEEVEVYKNAQQEVLSNRKKLKSITENPTSAMPAGDESNNEKGIGSLNENNFQEQFSAFPVDPGYNQDGAQGTG